MNDNSSFLGKVLLEGFKDKFIILCGGALILSIVYYFYKESFDAYIINEKYPQFSYIASVVLLLGGTFIAHFIDVLLSNIVVPFLEKRGEENNFKGFISTLTLKELTLVKDTLLHNAGSRGSSNDLTVKSKEEIKNLLIADKISNLRFHSDDKKDEYYQFNIHGLIFGMTEKKYKLLEKEIAKKNKKK